MHLSLSPRRIGAAALVAAAGFGAAAWGISSRSGTAQSQYLAADHVVLKNARNVDVRNQTAVLPIHKGSFNGKTVWYILTDASDFGIARDLDVHYAPKLANLPIGCPECVQQVTLGKPSGKFNNDAVVNFAGIPDFAPTRIFTPGPGGFPPSKAQPGAVGDAKYSPYIRIAGSPVIYNAPIIAVGDGPFDVVHHTNTAERVLAIDTKLDDDGPEATLLLARGFDSGQPILYLSTEASDPGAAAVERATYVPLLGHAAFANGDDNLGSARERIFVFLNGQTGKDNPEAQGLQYVAKDGNLDRDATLENSATLATSLNVQGDFPSLDDPRHANAYSPLWDVQLGEWTKAAIAEHKNVRQTDENEILNLVGRNALTGPGGAAYGSVFVVNCPPVAFINERPTKDKADNVFNR
ncbi:hypothetical protein WPS_33030 [Vulcanimicrobium alpinum]|uniref:Uncharacterized protein n=1 Tax=Vulcanimicrobium alpinum TaxID=3016050 RepID=A0AAN1XZ23_UNVUL|nr:hypothetical protein [Vulcanimicrobium alpinum]BDE08027.1 hypothetical protein WPS_33030 [Vulcanimicrobium alpinum]